MIIIGQAEVILSQSRHITLEAPKLACWGMFDQCHNAAMLPQLEYLQQHDKLCTHYTPL